MAKHSQKLFLTFPVLLVGLIVLVGLAIAYNQLQQPDVLGFPSSQPVPATSSARRSFGGFLNFREWLQRYTKRPPPSPSGRRTYPTPTKFPTPTSSTTRPIQTPPGYTILQQSTPLKSLFSQLDATADDGGQSEIQSLEKEASGL